MRGALPERVLQLILTLPLAGIQVLVPIRIILSSSTESGRPSEGVGALSILGGETKGNKHLKYKETVSL